MPNHGDEFIWNPPTVTQKGVVVQHLAHTIDVVLKEDRTKLLAAQESVAFLQTAQKVVDVGSCAMICRAHGEDDGEKLKRNYFFCYESRAVLKDRSKALH